MDFELHTVYKDKDVMVTVTELDYSPEQKQSFSWEYIPAYVEIVSGFLDTNEFSFEEVVETNPDLLLEELLKLYEEGL